MRNNYTCKQEKKLNVVGAALVATRFPWGEQSEFHAERSTVIESDFQFNSKVSPKFECGYLNGRLKKERKKVAYTKSHQW